MTFEESIKVTKELENLPRLEDIVNIWVSMGFWPEELGASESIIYYYPAAFIKPTTHSSMELKGWILSGRGWGYGSNYSLGEPYRLSLGGPLTPLAGLTSMNYRFPDNYSACNGWRVAGIVHRDKDSHFGNNSGTHNFRIKKVSIMFLNEAIDMVKEGKRKFFLPEKEMIKALNRMKTTKGLKQISIAPKGERFLQRVKERGSAALPPSKIKF